MTKQDKSSETLSPEQLTELLRLIKGADTVGRDSRGYDAGKKINGRTRFIVTDTLGLLIVVVVLAASVQDRDGARTTLLSA